MKKVVIAQAKRSAVGSFMGTLAALPVVDLGTQIIEGVLAENAAIKTQIDEVYMGQVLTAGVGQNPARQAALKAGIPESVPASTINTVCGSGMHAVGLAAQSILAGNAELCLAGGMENMSASPHYLKNGRSGLRLGNAEMQDAILSDGISCPINQIHMGITAENVAAEFNVSRQDQDAFALQSQMKAAAARKNGRFVEEIQPVIIKTRKADVVFAQDEFIRENTTLEALAGLKPAFKKDGTVTAGNASGINDGAAAMLVLSDEKRAQLGLQPLAVIHGFSLAGLRPDIMGMGPIYAIRKLQAKLNFEMKEIGLWELNEAFASQSIAVVRELGIDESRVNVNGGAIALGHPIGASGARILVTLMYEMKRAGIKFGIASMCIGTGMGIAMLLENPAA